jgi:hypothetical protein
VAWYFRVSDPKVLPYIKGDPPRSANEEHIIKYDHARYMLDSLSIIRTWINLVEIWLSRDLTVEEYHDVLMGIRMTCMSAIMYSMTKTRKQERRQDMAPLIFSLFNFM